MLSEKYGACLNALYRILFDNRDYKKCGEKGDATC